jgi:hypothetical protein
MKSIETSSTKIILAILALATLLLDTGTANAVIINFDTFPNGTPVPNGTLITDQYAPYVRFSSPTAAGGPIAGVFSGEASSSPNVLEGVENGAGLLPITLDFEPSFTTNSFDVTLISVGAATVTATAFGRDLTTVLDSVSVTHGDAAGVGLGNRDPIALTGVGIASVRVEITKAGAVPDGFAIDDIAFSPLVVPEPSASLALVIGLLGWSIGACRRKSRSIRGHRYTHR